MPVRMLVLLVDALGWTLAARHPQLAPGLDQRRRLATILGFSSGALPTIFTGRPPSDHGRFLMYRRALGATPFSGFEWLRFAPGRVQKSYKLGKVLHREVVRRGVAGYFNLYQVPRWLLPEFDLAERDDIFSPGGLPIDSWWDTLERRRMGWRGWNWRTPEAANLVAVERCLTTGDERVMFCYTADLDAALHAEGSSGHGVRARLERYDAFLTQACRTAQARGETLWIYLLSDHGMVDVHGTVDVIGRLASLPQSWPRDYLPFFDSTFARFWWRDRAARDPVRAALAGLPGRWLEPAELERENCRFEHAEYGEDLFLLDPGQLMVPSFMGTKPVAAMHGYDPAHPDMAALLWSNRPVPEHVRHLTDVRGFLESELDALERESA